jgi:DNA mismatch repair ATPase MutS
LQNKYLILIKEHESYIKKTDLTYNIIGHAKIFLVLLIGFLIYLLFSKKFPLEIIVYFSSAFIVLVILWIYHAKLNNRMDYSKGIISICKQHIDRITGKWTAFQDTGSEFMDNDHAYACDLDVVGKKSLFQFLNTTHTWHGRQAFADDLLRPVYGRSELHKRQEAIAELSTEIEFSSKIQYYLSKTREDSSSKLVDNLKNNTAFTKNEALRIILTYTPVLTLLFIAFIIVFQQGNLYFLGTLIVMAQAIIWILGISKIQNYLGVMTHLSNRLNAYNDVMDILRDQDFSCENLKQIQENLKEAAQAIKNLSKIDNRISIKHNAIIYFILNTFLLWDYKCVFLLQDWKRKYAHLVEQWFLSIGEFESMLCFSHLPNVCENTCSPTINEEGSLIEAKELGHPLLVNEKRVNNEVYLRNNIFIISGSNMSGKTTFLRTVGVNIVLARSGSFVCAKKMHVSLFDVVTSMRIADDLNEGVSTFYAELKRIKIIIEHAEKRPNFALAQVDLASAQVGFASTQIDLASAQVDLTPAQVGMIFLIDEIFKGTNSIDRLTGAKTVIAKLNTLGAVGLISTHDLELCELTGIYKRIKNYSFSEHYKDDRICFDYKMKPGKSDTTNAKYLMNMVGIFD